MKYIESIVIVFENCDSVEIPVDWIDSLSFNGVTKSFVMSSSDLSLRKFNKAEYVSISFDKKFETIQCSFGQENAKERILKYPDITQIEIKYEGSNDTELFFVKWCGNGDENTLQRTYEDCGFCVEIGETSE